MKWMDNVRDIIKRLFGIDPLVTADESMFLREQNRKYKDPHGVNLTAIFAGKLATLTVAESTVAVTGGNQRAEGLNGSLVPVWGKARKWTSIALGTGGVLLVPYVANGRMFTDIIPQSSLVINRVNGDELRAISILADSTVQGDRRFFRWTDYTLADDGLLTIRQRATGDTGAPVPLASLAEWESINAEMTISGVEHLPLAYIKCPADNRRDEALYGVPITFGCDDLIREITECLEDIRREYRLKRPIVGMDQTLFDSKDNRRHLPVTGLFMPTMPGGLDGSGKLWEVYDPAIRDSSYYNRLTNLYGLLEKQVGTSRGILTEPATRGATATEIKAGLYDTYALVDLMRSAIEQGIKQLVYGMDVLGNAFGLFPMGDYEIAFDWSYSMIESSQETFNQLVTAMQQGAVEAAELRNFVIPGETPDEARERCAEIAAAKKDSAKLLMEEALSREAQLG